MPDPSLPWHPEAFAAISMSALETAFWADKAAFALRRVAAQSVPPDLSPEQLAQRKFILGIAEKIMLAERDKAMDEAAAQWKDYRTHA